MIRFWIFLGILLTILVKNSDGACNCKSGYKCVLDNCVVDVVCPEAAKYGKGPPSTCPDPIDPLNKPKSKLESWFTKEIFNDLFPKANIGWGPSKCWPYSYESLAIASRYFPQFGTESPTNGFTPDENYKRDLAAFFSHAIQETGENNPSLYSMFDKERADACFYRGGFYNWFEGGPTSSFLPPSSPGYDPKDGEKCTSGGLYCSPNDQFPCSQEKDGAYSKGCYFGRGAIQISYNFNYGPFQTWLAEQGVVVDLLKNPNLVMTKMDPPLAMMASMWFYMTPQPPKPAMHDIVLGNWKSADIDAASGYKGAIFGPTSLVINNECGGEDADKVGGGGESRRIKAFKWFSQYFGFKLENDTFLSCKNMQVRPFLKQKYPISYQVNWATTWKDEPCQCATADYAGSIPYFAPGYYPQRFVEQNEKNRQACVKDLYANGKNKIAGQNCLKYPPKDSGSPSQLQPQPQPQPQPQRPNSNPNGPFTCPGAGVFSDPASCNSFYQCLDANTPVKQSCPPGLMFNAIVGVCDWPQNVKC